MSGSKRKSSLLTATFRGVTYVPSHGSPYKATINHQVRQHATPTGLGKQRRLTTPQAMHVV